jgi:hypothetical protein
MLLRRGLPALEASVTGSSVVLRKAKYLIGSVEGYNEGRVNEISCNPTVRENIWQT